MEAVKNIYAQARLFMQKTGNKNQWIDGYPSKELILDDISGGNSYLCTDAGKDILGVFFFREGDDASYARIYEGKWLNDHPYGVVHRLAKRTESHGVASFCLQWCFRRCRNVRIDTHRDNAIMQHVLQKNGYLRCGIIYLANGAERIAFQKSGIYQ
jgi:hypothetical protein